MTPGCPFRPLGKERGGETTGQSFQIGALTTHPLPPPSCVADRPRPCENMISDAGVARQRWLAPAGARGQAAIVWISGLTPKILIIRFIL
jgi:hypothetical protein